MNKIYIFISFLIIACFFNVFPNQTPLSNLDTNTPAKVLLAPPGVITLVSPNGGESWQAGTTQTIIWSDNLPGNVTIDLYKGGLFHSVISAGTASTGSKTWDLPLTLESGSDYSIKITSLDSISVSDSSDANFTIFPPEIIVTTPNGSDNWIIGEAYLITWTDNISEDVELHLYKGGVFNSIIIASTPSDGSYAWAVPLGTTPGSDYTIRISSVLDDNIFDYSDLNFSLSHEITVTFPNGGNSLL